MGRRYFNKRKHINLAIISPRADFSLGRHFNVTAAQTRISVSTSSHPMFNFLSSGRYNGKLLLHGVITSWSPSVIIHYTPSFPLSGYVVL